MRVRALEPFAPDEILDQKTLPTVTADEMSIQLFEI